MRPHTISSQALHQVLRYEEETGKLFWRARSAEMFGTQAACNAWNARYAGEEALANITGFGHKVGTIFGKNYSAHRVIWALHFGVWPSEQIDHIDGDPGNNRVNNLRDVSLSINLRNSKRRRHNVSGHNGIHWDSGTQKWRAVLGVGGKRRHLGLFTNIEDAVAVRRAAQADFGYTERHGTLPEETPAPFSNSRAPSTREHTGTGGTPPPPVPVQIYDGFVERKSDVWRRV